MLLIIHNLPLTIKYPEIKSILELRCGIQDAILDDLTPDGCGMRVTVGLAEEEDAAILTRKLNGYNLGGAQLYVEDVRKKRKAPKGQQNQQSSSNFNDQFNSMLQLQQAQLLAQNHIIGQAQNTPMVIPAPNYESVMGMYALQQNNMMNYGGQLQQFPTMVPFPSQGLLDPSYGQDLGTGYQDKQQPIRNAWDDSNLNPLGQRSDMDCHGQGSPDYLQKETWDNQGARVRPNIRRSRSLERDSQRQQDRFQQKPRDQSTRWDDQPVDDPYNKANDTAVESTRTNALLPTPSPRNRNARDSKPFPQPRLHDRHDSRFESKAQEQRPYSGNNSHNIPSPRGNRYDRDNSRNKFADSRRQNYDPNSERPFLLDSPRDALLSSRKNTSLSPWTRNHAEPFKNPSSDYPSYERESEIQHDLFGRQNHAKASFGPRSVGPSDPHQNESKPGRRALIGSDDPRDTRSSGSRPGAERNSRSGCGGRSSAFDSNSRSSGPRAVFESDSRSRGSKNTFENKWTSYGPRSLFESNARSSATKPGGPRSSFESSSRFAGPMSSGPRASFASTQNPSALRPINQGSAGPSTAGQDRNALKRPYEISLKYLDDPQPKRFANDTSSKKKSVREIDAAKAANTDFTWRSQAAAVIAKEMLCDLQMSELIRKQPFMQKLKYDIRSRIDVILHDRFLVPANEIQVLYRKTFLKSEDQELFLEVLDKVEKEAEEKAKAYEADLADPHKANAAIKTDKPTPEIKAQAVKPTSVSKPAPVIKLAPISKLSSGSASKIVPASSSAPITRPDPSSKPVSVTKPVTPTVSKPAQVSNPTAVTKPAPDSKPSSALVASAATRDALIAVKKGPKAQKQIVKLEHKTENMYTMEPTMQKALDDEWSVIEKLYMKECANPIDDNEKQICQRLVEKAKDELKRAIKLNVTKRICQIHTGLVVRVFGAGKLPKKENVAKFLERYGALSLKKSDRTKMYVATVNSYENFDALCNVKDCIIDGIQVSFRPMQGVKPSAQEARELHRQRTANFIERQINDGIDVKPGKEADEIVQVDDAMKEIDQVHESSETNEADHSNDEPKGLVDGEFVTIDETGMDEECEEFEEDINESIDQLNAADIDVDNIDEDDLEDY